MTKEEREQTAYHEAGHALVLYFLHPTDDVFKATIKTRGAALGMVSHHPREELYTASREKLLADIKVMLAGYAAEKVKYGTTSTGVASDFQHATQLAHTMVWRLGMGASGGLLGDFSALPQNELSDNLKERLNMETIALLNDGLSKVEHFLKKEWNVVEVFAQELLAKEELDYDAIESILKSLNKQRENIPDLLTKDAQPQDQQQQNPLT